jgi:hypothetical protein
MDEDGAFFRIGESSGNDAGHIDRLELRPDRLGGEEILFDEIAEALSDAVFIRGDDGCVVVNEGAEKGHPPDEMHPPGAAE